MKKFISLILLMISAILISAICLADVSSEAQFVHKEDFIGRKVALPTGSTYDVLLEDALGGVNICYYSDIASQVEALRKGDVDAICNDLPVGYLLCSNHPDMAVFPEVIRNSPYGFGFRKGNPLRDEFTALLDGYRADGTLDALEKKWLLEYRAGEVLIDEELYDFSGRTGGELQVYAYTDAEPMCFIGQEGIVQGYEPELLLMIAKELDMSVTIASSLLDSMMLAVSQGKADMLCGTIGITAERQEQFDFTSPTYEGGVIFICRRADIADYEGTAAGKGSFRERFLEGFEKTFIRENRWKLILSGLLLTLKVTLLAALCGTAAGFLLLLAGRSSVAWLRKILKWWCSIVSGIPAPVILMLTYFAVFSELEIQPVSAGVIAYTVIFSVAVYGALNAGVKSVDPGQWEAGTALGAGRGRVFFQIVLPQAARITVPLYKGEMVSMMKLTSVLGYIAVQDLTKVGDIIKGRTFDAYFPLVTIALLYFLISTVIIVVFDRVEIRCDYTKRIPAYPRSVNVTGQIEEGFSGYRSGGQLETVQLEHIQKEYSSGAIPLKDVNATIRRGDVIAVIGPSGTGKSTLLRLINRLEKPTGGRILVDGREISMGSADREDLHRRIGMVFQSFNLFPHMSVLENIMYAPVHILKQDPQAVFDRSMQLLKSVGMDGRALNMPASLSGGQKQRVAIARALAMEPELLLFDEPTSALDPTMVEEVLSVIRRLSEQGMSMMIVTHEMAFARNVSNRVFYLDQGEIYEEGTPEQIFETPRRNRTKIFIEKLRTVAFTIDSEHYDDYVISEGIRKFCQKVGISPAIRTKLSTCFEAVLQIPGVIPPADAAHKLHMLCVYDERQRRVYLRFIRDGEADDPMQRADQDTEQVLAVLTQVIGYTYSDGIGTLNLEFED